MPVQAQTIPTAPQKNNCVNCHENLYFLHDTGNWFCLRESPMRCVDCHGGNPEAITKELAHLQRAEHPVVNEDVSQCQQCHLEECNEHVELFDRAAGISQILVAAPYLPADSTDASSFTAIEPSQPERGSFLLEWEIVPLILVTTAALTIYFVAHRRLKKKEKDL
jgi:hypothetical protein